MKRLSIILVLLIWIFSRAPIHAQDLTPPSQIQEQITSEAQTQCRSFFSNDGFLFANYESHGYENGLLSMHFKLKKPYNDGRGWIWKTFLLNDDCAAQAVVMPALERSDKNMEGFSVRFTSPTHFQFWNDDTGTVLECQSCGGDIPGQLDGGQDYASVDVFFGDSSSFLHSGSYPIKEQTKALTPVLIIPGLLGTELHSFDKSVWPNLEKILSDPSDSFMDVLKLNQFGTPSDSSIFASPVLGKIDYVLGTYHYSDLLSSDLKGMGYEESKNLFYFPYDWRLSINDASSKLKTKIESILSATGRSKVNIVAHSLGGLVLKESILSNPELEDRIDNAFFVGVPNLGSAKAAKVLIFGDNLDVPLLNPQEIKFLAQNMASLYELLPSKEYFKHIAGFYDDLTDQRQLGILGYDASKSFLRDLGYNAYLIDQAEKVHSTELDNLDLSNKKFNAYNIVGCGLFTIKTVNKMFTGKPNFFQKLSNQTKYKIEGESGDGTVIEPSAKYLKVPSGNTMFAPNAIHGRMLADEGIRSLIASVILKNNPSRPLANDNSGCRLEGKLISFPSNLELQIKDSNSKDLVPDLDVPVQSIGSDKYMFLPTSESKNYNLKAKLSSGSSVNLSPINISIDKYVSGQYIGSKFYTQIKINDNSRLNLNISDGSDKVVLDESDSLKEIVPDQTGPVEEQDSSQQPAQANSQVSQVPQIIIQNSNPSANPSNKTDGREDIETLKDVNPNPAVSEPLPNRNDDDSILRPIVHDSLEVVGQDDSSTVEIVKIFADFLEKENLSRQNPINIDQNKIFYKVLLIKIRTFILWFTHLISF